MGTVNPASPATGSAPGADIDASFTLDPTLLAQRRAQASYRVYAVQVPLIRAAGFVVLCLMVIAQVGLGGDALGDPNLVRLLLANIAYAAVAGLLLNRLHGHARVDWSFVFFHLDLVLFLANLYYFERGGVLFFAYFLLIRVADQVGFGFRRAAYFGHVVVLSYLAYSLFVVPALRPDTADQQGSERLVIGVTMYLLAFYLASTGFVMERMRRRSNAAVRTARALVGELEHRNHALQEQAAELERARLAAEQASVAKSQFLAMVSHEIRTPMHGVLGANELLLATPLTPTQRRYVETAHRSGKALMTLMDDVIDLSRIEGGQALTLDAGPLDLRGLLEDATSLARHMLRDKPLTLRLLVPPELPQALQGDATRLRQLLVNLLHNAIKFTDAGEIRLTAQCLSDEPLLAWMRFEVTDTGIGIAADQHESVWDMFRQADTSSTRRHGGSGLGLAIVRQIVDLMGGRAGLDSQPGTGSTFWVELPMPKGPPSAAAPVSAVADAPSPARGAVATRVLLAEDNAVNQMVLREMLEVLGCEVTVVGDGDAACVAVERAVHRGAPYEVVFMDCHMPTMDGFAATRRIREDEAGARPPRRRQRVVALTADALAGDRERCLQAGMDDYLTKPVGIDQLAHALHEPRAA